MSSALLGALLAGLASGGCRAPGTGAGVSASPEAPLKATVVLAMGVNSDEQIDAQLQQDLEQRFQGMGDGFRVLHPGVHLELQLFREEALIDNVRRRHFTGLGPDLMLVNESTARDLVRQGLARAVRFPEAVTNQLQPGVLASARLADGRLVGLPVMLAPEIACFDRRRLPRSPTTLAELRRVGAGRGLVGLPIDATNLIWSAGAMGALDALKAARAGRAVTAEQRQRISGWLSWLQQANLSGDITFQLSQEQLIQGLERGQFHWISCRSTQVPRLRRQLGAHLGVATLPDGPLGPATPTARQRLLSFGLDSSAGQRRAAETLALFTINPPVQRSMTERSPDVLPVNRSVVPAQQNSALIATLARAARQSIRATSIPALVGDNATGRARLQRLITGLLYGELDTPAATEAMIRVLQGGAGR